MTRRSAFDEEIRPGRRIWRIADDRIKVTIETPEEGSDDWMTVAEAVFER